MQNSLIYPWGDINQFHSWNDTISQYEEIEAEYIEETTNISLLNYSILGVLIYVIIISIAISLFDEKSVYRKNKTI